jgi:hypothetical protein
VAQQVLAEQQAKTEIQVRLVPQVIQAQRVQLEHRVNKERLETLVLKVLKVPRVIKV